jgi:phosphate starvation-inducible protein PhoH and related proteins
MTEQKRKRSGGELKKYTFANEELYEKICGVNDAKLKELETSLGVDIIPRGTSLILGGDDEKVQKALDFFRNLESNYERRPDKQNFDTFDVNYLMNKTEEPKLEEWTPKDKIITTFQGRNIFPKTKNQELFVNSLFKNMVSFAVGPAGTGKTFLTIATACRFLQQGQIDRIVLTRPAVEAGESLGFLPGDLMQKVDPYLRPVYDALYECIGFEKAQEYIASNRIEIAPIAFMRGRTLSNSFVVLDEAQNCTLSQLKMFLTRLGKNARMSISGDITQVDLVKEKSGLEKVVRIFEETEGIGITFFDKKDISRHPLVELIVKKFEGVV